MAVQPSFVNARGFGIDTGASGVEMELRFNLEPPSNMNTNEMDLWPNWQLAFVHTQLFKHFEFSARWCPSPFHMTFTRNAQYRSEAALHAYLQQASAAVETWRERGPVILEPASNKSTVGYPDPVLGEEVSKPGGVYLFKSRNEPQKYFAPNWEPPYNNTEKRATIQRVLSEVWNSDKKDWEPAAWSNTQINK